jgi:hypothetical protein
MYIELEKKSKGNKFRFGSHQNATVYRNELYFGKNKRKRSTTCTRVYLF